MAFVNTKGRPVMLTGKVLNKLKIFCLNEKTCIHTIQ